MANEPLTESYFYILLCLYINKNHGYGIMLETDRLSNGRVKIASGTMYGAVSNMIKKDWIKEVRSDDPGDYRKRVYDLTQEGIKIFKEEATRLGELSSNATRALEEKEGNSYGHN